MKREARKQGLIFEIIELKRHTGIKIGNTTRTLGRHSEIPNKTVVKFHQQFFEELGSRWWR